MSNKSHQSSVKLLLTSVSQKNGQSLKVIDLSVFSGLNETLMILVDNCGTLEELNLCFLTKYRSMVRDQWWHNLNLQNISYLVNNLTTSIRLVFLELNHFVVSSKSVRVCTLGVRALLLQWKSFQANWISQ